MLRAIMEALDGIIRPEDVVVLIATGTHRASTAAERRAMLGDDVLARWRVEDHDARDDSGQVDMGMVGDVPVFLDRQWVAADLRITTGFVEPHFFAGFSGGPKMVAPRLAGLATTLELHNARRLGDPRATWGVIEGNPVHDAVRAIAAATLVDFALDVLLDDEQKITRAFGGQIVAMHTLAIDDDIDRSEVAVDETSLRTPFAQGGFGGLHGVLGRGANGCRIIRRGRHVGGRGMVDLEELLPQAPHRCGQGASPRGRDHRSPDPRAPQPGGDRRRGGNKVVASTASTSGDKGFAWTLSGPPGWHDNPEWKGWWGPNPPFHTPSSSSPIARASQSRWRAARPSTGVS